MCDEECKLCCFESKDLKIYNHKCELKREFIFLDKDNKEIIFEELKQNIKLCYECINRSSWSYQFLPDEHKMNVDLIYHLLLKDYWKYHDIPKEYKNSREFHIELMKKSGKFLSLPQIYEKYGNDIDIVLEAVKTYPSSIKYISSELRIKLGIDDIYDETDYDDMKFYSEQYDDHCYYNVFDNNISNNKIKNYLNIDIPNVGEEDYKKAIYEIDDVIKNIVLIKGKLSLVKQSIIANNVISKIIELK
jgi:hypothetical protein